MTFSCTAIGVMSGTSLDGLDLSVCRYTNNKHQWEFEVLATATLNYESDWKETLKNAYGLKGSELASLNMSYGKFIGSQINAFIKATGIRPDLISSHGHTVFHQPENGFTLQIGSGAAIAAVTGIDTVCDLRSADVANGGQGAPLVPIGDQLLFGGHKFCLNLGGIANISFASQGSRVAFDICPVNMALNELAEEAGKNFDEGGEMAVTGIMIPTLFEQLKQLPFYQKAAPKSLGREWYEKEFLPLLKAGDYRTEDKLHTVTKHIAGCIADAVPVSPGTTMLVTGGGAYNTFLVECIADALLKTGVHLVIPDEDIIKFKEAIIFGLLGVLRKQGLPNILSSVTGASADSCGGCIYSGAVSS